MNGTANRVVSMRLTHDEFVTFVMRHSGHFTRVAGERIAGELTDGSQYGYRTLRKIVCHRHGETCTAAYDNSDSFYWVRTDAYPDEAAAWADTVDDSCGCWNARNLGHCIHGVL